MYKIFTDTDCDISLKESKEYDLGLISMPYTANDVLVRPYEDFEVFDSKAFYNMLREGVMPTTSAISMQNYIDYFEPVLAAGTDILYVHFSRAMSNSFDFMDQAVKELLVKYPERKFYEIDTKGITVISRMMVLEAVELKKQGKTAEEIVEWAKTEVDHFAMYFMAEDLKFFHRSGRVSGLSATMGTLLGIRPIIYMSPEGKMVSVGKEKGRKKAVQHLVNKVIELGDDVKAHGIVLGHTDNDEVVAEIVAALKAHFGDDLNIYDVPTNPTAGSHCGAGGVGVAFHSVSR